VARPRAIVPVKTERNFIRFMLYGKPDSGKSVLAGTSPKGLILASDPEETLSAARHGSDCDMWVVQDYDALEEAGEWIRHEGWKEYLWVWLDNGSLFQEQGMDQIMTELFASKTDARTGKVETKQNRYVPDKPQYLQNQNRLAAFLRMMRSVPIHFGITAHEMLVEWANGDENLMPAFQGGQGQYSQRICGYMNIIGHLTSLTTKEGDFKAKLRVRHTSSIMAKDRYKAFPPVIVNPTIPKMMEDILKVLPTLGQRVAPATVTRTSKAAVTKKAAPPRKAAPTIKKAAPAKKASAAKTTAAKKTTGRGR
jgi:hypothetical protein